MAAAAARRPPVGRYSGGDTDTDDGRQRSRQR
ncbi:hypothetical protein BPC006_I2504 [Burkholderia pseudomallei BPC006]|nr:hypothetical protein BPC006_I2504 [Burkholderia pseudomallei BPC006]